MLGPMKTGCGVKRKFAECQDVAMDERQSILNISMCKLKITTRRRGEPSLRRSVLIFNTLKHIETELRREGVVALTSADKSDLWPTLQAADRDAVDTLDPPPTAQMANDRLLTPAPLAPSPLDSPPFPDLNPPDMSLLTLTPPSDKLTAKSSPGVLQHRVTATDVLLNTEKLTVCGFSALYDLDRSSDVDLDCDMPSSPMTPNMMNVTSPVTSSSSMMASSFASLTAMACSPFAVNPDIFSDVDLSLYDFDLLSSFNPTMKLAPLSAEELLHSFPGDETAPSYPPSSQRRRSELLGEDIDHIMQVLVGI